MTNTSATGGYLAPTSTGPDEDLGFDSVLQEVVVGITGLTGSLVVPRWQPVTPTEPDVTTDWCAIGITSIKPDENVSILHHPDGLGYDEMRQQETVDVLASFFGPNAYNNASILRDGLYLPQNREALFFKHIGLLEVGTLVQIPDLVNQNWRRRVDVPFTLRRMVTRIYAIESLVEAVGTIQDDNGRVEPFDTNNHH